MALRRLDFAWNAKLERNSRPSGGSGILANCAIEGLALEENHSQCWGRYMAGWKVPGQIPARRRPHLGCASDISVIWAGVRKLSKGTRPRRLRCLAQMVPAAVRVAQPPNRWSRSGPLLTMSRGQLVSIQGTFLKGNLLAVCMMFYSAPQKRPSKSGGSFFAAPFCRTCFTCIQAGQKCELQLRPCLPRLVCLRP